MMKSLLAYCVIAISACGGASAGDKAPASGGSAGQASGGSSSTGGSSSSSDAGSGGSSGSGTGGASGAGGNPDGVQCWPLPAQFPTFDRACETKDSCAIVSRQADCCGSIVVTGIDAAEVDRFEADAAVCRMQFPACGCASGPTRTDSGQEAPNIASVQVECEASGCTTFVP